MCRAGGRRCEASTGSSRATQTLRQQRSRARRALRAARAAGDTAAVARAQHRLDTANAALDRHKEHTMTSNDHSNHDQRREQPRDEQAPRVVNQVFGENHGYQAEVINGGITFHAGGGFTIGNTNIAQPGANVSSQHDVNHTSFRQDVPGPARDVTGLTDRAADRVRRAAERAQRAGERGGGGAGGGFTVHTGPREDDGGRSVNVTDGSGNTFMQVGRHYGDLHVNGVRID